MATFNIERARKHLQAFNFADLFIEELGWNHPPQPEPDTIDINELKFTRCQIAELAGVIVFEVTAEDGLIPDAKIRAAAQKQLAQHHHENLLIFLDAQRAQSVWYWVKRDGGKRYPRSHYYVTGQTGDLFLSKIGAMFVDMSDLDDEGNMSVVAVANRLKDALDIERVTKKFFDEFKFAHTKFLGYIGGIDDERDRRWYTSVVLNRIMFVWFLQKKGFIDNGDTDYLQGKLEAGQTAAAEQYYAGFLQPLFFEGFAKPENQRDSATNELLGKIKYLNGGLFLPHPIEDKYGAKINIPDEAFEQLFALFKRYSWNLDDTLGGKDDEINPDVLGYIFEKYINQKAFGAYYTRPEITEYLCQQTIHKLILDKLTEINQPIPGLPTPPEFDSIGDLLLRLDAPRCSQLLHKVLPTLSLLDPAVGSGAFLVAALKTLVEIYQGVIGKIPFLKDGALTQWLDKIKARHPSLDYFIKKEIITNNLHGVDIMAEAVEIARLRLFLALVASAESVDDLEPLPNIDFNILPGNSLIGLLRVDPRAFDAHTQTGIGKVTQQEMFGERRSKSYDEIVAEKNRLIANYKDASSYTDDLQALRDNILAHRHKANATLNQLLLDEFQNLKIKFEQATWDTKKNKPGKRKKRPLTIADIENLEPFHWGYEFDEVINERGGFDAIITNPPWEIFKPNSREFFANYSSEVSRRKLSVKAFKKIQAELLKDANIRDEWLAYSSSYPHANLFFRNTQQYKNQISIVSGRRASIDINLYKLFVEQCYNLLHSGGQCGIVIPSGIYSDLGTKQLRELMFKQTQITGLICFENRKGIFEDVHRSFKFVVLTFAKGDCTSSFSAAFMRHDVTDLAQFPQEGGLALPVNLVQRLAPDSLSIMEFKSEIDVLIAEKMIHFPLLGEHIDGVWNLSFSRELHMTDDSNLFKLEPNEGDLSLYEGRMIWHFEHKLQKPRYWVGEHQSFIKLRKGRAKKIKKLLREAKIGVELNEDEIKPAHNFYRIGFRAITGATNERTLVATILPKSVVTGNSLNVCAPLTDRVANKSWVQERSYTDAELLASKSFLSSFVCDWFIRQKILTNMNIFYLYQLPVPRLTEKDPAFAPIVERATKLICTAPEFDDLAAELAEAGFFQESETRFFQKNLVSKAAKAANATVSSADIGVTNPVERAKLRAELDGIIAHVYGLTEKEFSHILSTFPLVDDEVKDAALQEYRRLAPDPEIMTLIANGEGTTVEFKEAVRRNPHTGKDGQQKMSDNIVKAVAGMMNGSGGSLLIGAIVNKSKANWDGYQLSLEDLLKNKLAIANAFRFFHITPHTIEDKTICRIRVQPGDGAAYVDDKLYVRTGNQSSELQGPELVAYVNGERWKK
ncbi:MAG: hypothetical protein B6243_02315 [Anaerolineaceae bacterium 4572_5.2]|nr:MAG: hypothetical protein B6243_02315 [Anaerolineaceae bacterium 4572_5.2]